MAFPSVASYPLRSQLDKMPVPAWKPLPEGRLRQVHVRYGKGPVRARKGKRIQMPVDVWQAFKDLACEPVEVFRVVFLDSGNRLMAYEDIARGSIDRITHIRAREVFYSAVHLRAFAVIVAHNHPSGVLEPSDQDIALTRTLRQAGKLLGIEVLDHVIVADGGFYSFHEHGI